MPWKVEKKEDKYCVIKEDDGKQLKCYTDKSEADKYRDALYANANEEYENLEALMLEEGSPVILGVAATNRPHLPLPPMSVVEKDGEEYIRVPFLRKGIFRHPSGNLVFNDGVFKEMLQNHNNKKSHYGVSLDIRHKPELGALAWFDSDRGGFVELEKDSEFGPMLVGYGKPTSEEAKKIINNKQYVFASVEFHPKWKGNLVQKLSMDEVEEIVLEDLVEDLMVDKIELEEKSGKAFVDSLISFVKKAKSNQSYVLSVKEKNKDLEELGFTKTDDGYALSHSGVKELLSLMLGYDEEETKLEDLENIQLFNPYHSKSDGRFVSKGGGSSGSTSTSKQKSSGEGFTKNRRGQVLRGITEGIKATALGIKPKPLNRNHKKYQVIGRALGGGLGIAGAVYAGYKIGAAIGKVAAGLEEIMEEVTITLEEYSRLTALEDEIKELKKETEVEEIPEKVRVKLEEQDKEIQRLKRKGLEDKVELIISKAQSYRDEDGRGHSPVLLEMAKAAMLGLEVRVDEEESIKLESVSTSDIVDYNRKIWIRLLETLPGQILFESQVESEDEDNPYTLQNEYDKEVYSEFWANI